ncbi:MAG: glycosyltransferase family 2 protein [Cyclobacteriaceae bacterium]
MSGITVIIPTHNRTRYLEEAVKSVLSQTVPATEIILVNDGSQVEHHEELDRIQRMSGIIRRFDNKTSLGVSSSRNIGLENATGDFICFLDDDDVLLEDFFEKALDVFQDEVKIDALITRTEVLDDGAPKNYRRRHVENLIQERFSYYGDIDENTAGFFLTYCPMIHSFLFRRSVFDVLRFDPNLKYGEDIFLWITMLQSNVTYKKVDWVGAKVRIHGANLSTNVGYDVKIKFLEKLDETAYVTRPKDKQLLYVRYFYWLFMLGDFRMFNYLMKALIYPSAFFKYLWFYIKVRLSAISSE